MNIESLPAVETLPPRIPASLVCKYAGYGKGTLSKRIKRGLMPPPVDRAKENMFLTSVVLEKLGITGGSQQENVNPLEKALDALRPA